MQVAKAAMENAKRRKDVVKAMSACTKDKEKMLVDDSTHPLDNCRHTFDQDS